jgi:hypothetical protein
MGPISKELARAMDSSRVAGDGEKQFNMFFVFQGKTNGL